jgi:DNA-binding SARP family transcriptional activator
MLYQRILRRYDICSRAGSGRIMIFRVLGSLEVWCDGRRVSLTSRRHQRLIAALLLSPNRFVSVSRLIEALWDEDPPATATKQVQNCVSGLRERLACLGDDLIVTDGAGYRLQVDCDQVDLLAFRHGIDRARNLSAEGKLAQAVAETREALALWRGPMLDGINTTWSTCRVAGFNEQRLSALEQCVDWEMSLGHSREVIDELTLLIGEHSLRERPHEQLMIALDRDGRPADALAVFHQLRKRLNSELGVDPGSQVRETYYRILRNEPESGNSGPPASNTSDSGTATPSRLSTGDRPTMVVAERDEPSDESACHPAPDDLEPAQRMLTTAVRRQWTIEVQMRSLDRPEPVQLTHSGTARPGGGRDYKANLATTFRQLPQRQLIVLGAPGAGKTVMAILLTLGLLDDPRPGEPVPVPLSVASWRPEHEHLHTWMSRTLAEEYPGLTNAHVYGKDAATRLVLSGRVLPVLDGLDEMPVVYQATAIDALDQVATGGAPLVVTCRVADYERAVREAGVTTAGVTVVEIEPVESAAAIAYLTAPEPEGSTRWRPVIDRLRGEPDGALARALRTPLMVSLARTAYRDPAADPAELCDTCRFPTATAYEDHLLDAYLPAVYSPRPTPPDQEPRRALRRYDPDRAERWLTYLARTLNRNRTQNLEWWRLHHEVPPRAMAAVLGATPAVLGAVCGFIAAGLLVCVVYGLSFGVSGYVSHSFGTRLGPRRVGLTFRGTSARFATRLAIGGATGTALGLGWALPPDKLVLIAAVFALGIGPNALLEVPIDAERVTSPRTVLRDDLVAAVLLMVSFATTAGTFYGMAFAFTNEVRFITVLWGRFDLVIAFVAGIVGAAIYGRLISGPVTIVASALCFAGIGGMVFPRATSLTTAIVTGAIFGVAIGIAGFLTRASVVFGTTRLWLAARGRLPLRLMTFLEDARRRGVLRQVGAVYQFRHARLQERLVSRVPARTGTRFDILAQERVNAPYAGQ